MKSIVFLLLIYVVAACTADQTKADGQSAAKAQSEHTEPKPPSTPVIVPTVKQFFPHDTMAFTQGLTISNGVMYESTGQYGVSEVRTVDLRSGRVIKRTRIGGQYFGEGSTVLGDHIYMITWLNQEGFVFDKRSLSKEKSFKYNGEGWGLTTDGKDLYMSNGSEVINVLSPEDFQVIRSITVRLDNKPCRYLNELEWIEGELWANVWQSDMIVCIDPQSGNVKRVLNLSSLYPIHQRLVTADVMNGIAYDAATHAIYVTGKNWPKVYQISTSE